ncbi:MAG: hypothetical protein ACT4NU_04405 [Chromatiales bacterium]
MSSHEVPQPILNSPYEEPARYWYIPEGAPSEERTGPARLDISTAILGRLLVKAQAARRWVDAVNADGGYGHWEYLLAEGPGEVAMLITRTAQQ